MLLNKLKYYIIILIILLLVFSHVKMDAQSLNTFNCTKQNHNTCQVNLNEYIGRMALNAKVIGLGEATHGTKEFIAIKSDIVKQLITKQGFRFFILEASYMDCQKINDYIHGQTIDTATIFKGIPWPWATQEFYTLLSWMRNYNVNINSSNAIVFIGTDLGNNSSIKLLIRQYSDSNDNILEKKILNIYSNHLSKPSEKIKLINKLFKNDFKATSFMDSFYKVNIKETVIFELLRGGKRYHYREDRFAKASIKMIDHFPKDKFILWAHNGHISKKSTDRKSLGNYLDQHYNKEYINLGFDFKTGCFKAVDLDSNRSSKKIFKYNLFCVDSNDLNIASTELPDSLYYKIFDLHHPITKTILPKKFNIRSVGAVYGKELAKIKPRLYFEKVFREKSFDFLLLLNTSSPPTPFYKIQRI